MINVLQVLGDDVGTGEVLTKKPVSCFVSQLTHIVALCEDRLPLIALMTDVSIAVSCIAVNVNFMG